MTDRVAGVAGSAPSPVSGPRTRQRPPCTARPSVASLPFGCHHGGCWIESAPSPRTPPWLTSQLRPVKRKHHARAQRPERPAGRTRRTRGRGVWTANAPGRLAVSLLRSLESGPASAAAAGRTVTPGPRARPPPAQPDVSHLFLGACVRVHRAGSEKPQIDTRHVPVLILSLQMRIKAHGTSVTCPVFLPTRDRENRGQHGALPESMPAPCPLRGPPLCPGLRDKTWSR